MNSIYIEGYIDSIEDLGPILEDLNNCDGEVSIYLTSPGGHISMMMAFKEAIESHPKRVELVALNEIQGSAMFLFLLADCDKHVAPFTTGVISTFPAFVDATKLKVDNHPAPLYMKMIEGHNKEYLRALKEDFGLTASELKKVRENGLLVGYNRLKKMIE